MTPATLSALDRLAVCPGSASLPHWREVSPESDAGKAMHAVREFVALRGRSLLVDSTLAAIADLYGLEGKARDLFFWHSRAFEPFPDGEGIDDGRPIGALAEVALCLWQDGSVTRVPWERSVDIPEADRARVVVWGKIDMIWGDPPFGTDCGFIRCRGGSALFVTDWKSGWESARPAARNLQVKAGGLLAARWTGATKVNVSLCLTECPKDGSGGHVTGGRWDAVELDAAALDAVEADVRRIALSVEFAASAGGEPPPWSLVAGPHCGYCPARPTCPRFAGELATIGAHTTEGLAAVTAERDALRAALQEAVSNTKTRKVPPAWLTDAQTLLATPRPALSLDRKVEAWAMRAAVERTMSALQASLAAEVKRRREAGEPPLTLPDGSALDVVLETVEELDPEIVWSNLTLTLDVEGRHPPDAWDALSASKEGIYQALKAAGIKPASKARDRVLAAVREAGGVTERARETLRAVSAKEAGNG